MAAIGPSGDAQVTALLARQGTTALHLLAWISICVFAVVLFAIWRDARRPGGAWWRPHNRRRW